MSTRTTPFPLQANFHRTNPQNQHTIWKQGAELKTEACGIEIHMRQYDFSFLFACRGRLRLVQIYSRGDPMDDLGHEFQFLVQKNFCLDHWDETLMRFLRVLQQLREVPVRSVSVQVAATIAKKMISNSREIRNEDQTHCDPCTQVNSARFGVSCHLPCRVVSSEPYDGTKQWFCFHIMINLQSYRLFVWDNSHDCSSTWKVYILSEIPPISISWTFVRKYFITASSSSSGFIRILTAVQFLRTRNITAVRFRCRHQPSIFRKCW